MEPVKIGVIGGSGLSRIDELKILDTVSLDTPFGKPSADFLIGELAGVRVAFLSRHGKGHSIPPTFVNYRANLWGLKMLGVERIVASGACGSFKDELPPGHIVVIDQFLDRTRNRLSTFTGPGLVAHVLFADPVCHDLADTLFKAGKDIGADITKGGTYVCMEGPQFSTRAESFFYKATGADVIGMTNLTEAKLAREAEMCYASLALVTDFDCWHESEDDVTIEAVLAVMQKNSETFTKILGRAIPELTGPPKCECGEAMKFAIITDPSEIPEQYKKDLDLVLGKYIK